MKDSWKEAKENKETITVQTINQKDIKRPIVGYEGCLHNKNGLEYHGKNFQDTVMDIKLKQLDKEFKFLK